MASLSQGRTAAAQCGLFTHKSVLVIFEPPCTSISLNLFLKCYIDCSLGLNGGCSRWLQMQESRICKLCIFNSKYWERCIETNFIYVNCNKKLGRRRTFIAFLVMAFAVKLVHLLSISSCMKKIFYCISFARSKYILRPIHLL